MKRTLSLILSLLMIIGVFAVVPFGAAESDIEDVGASYNLWLGSTQVTDANKDDILNDGGKAKFYPSTHTLVLNNPYIRGFYNNYCTIYASGINLMISGKYQMPSEGPYLEAGILVENGTLFLNGDFAFYGSMWGIKVVNGDLSIERGTLVAQESNMGALFLDTAEQRFFHTPYFGILCEGGQLLIKEDVECVDLYSAEMYSDDQWGAAVGADNIIIADGLSITDPEGAYIDKLELKYEFLGENITEYEGRTIYYDGLRKEHLMIQKPDFVWDYDLWLGSTKVNYLNKDDIFGDGLARFDPETETLTLNNPDIYGWHVENGESYQIYSKTMDLIVKGSYHLINSVLDNGIYSHSLTFDGNFSFTANDGYAVDAYNDLIISGGLLRAKGKYGKGLRSVTGDIRIGSGVTKVEAEGENYAMSASGKIVIDSSLEITEPTGAKNKQGYIYESDGVTVAKQVKIGKSSVGKRYNLWLGDVQVTDANKNALLGSRSNTFDPATNTLTLSYPMIIGEYHYSKIYSVGIDLTVKGNYRMTEPDTDYGIFVDNGSLTLDGSFAFLGTYFGIYAEEGLRLKGGSFVAKGETYYGIATYDGDIDVYNSVKYVEAVGGQYAICASWDLNGVLSTEPELNLVTPYDGYVDGGAVYDQNDNAVNRAIFATSDRIIYSVYVYGKPQAVLGLSAGDYPPDWRVATRNYSFVSKRWLHDCFNGSRWVKEEYTGAFEADKTYYAEFTLEPSFGYAFTDQYDIDVFLPEYEEGWRKQHINADGILTYYVPVKVQSEILGDVDSDGKVDIFDASSVQKSIAGVSGYVNYGTLDKDDLMFRVADVDRDGKVDIFDASLIQKYIAGSASAQGLGIGEPI